MHKQLRVRSFDSLPGKKIEILGKSVRLTWYSHPRKLEMISSLLLWGAEKLEKSRKVILRLSFFLKSENAFY